MTEGGAENPDEQAPASADVEIPAVSPWGNHRPLLAVGAGLKVSGLAVQLVFVTQLGFFWGYVLCLLGAIPFVTGCIGYARSKGWHGAVGLLGLFSFLGLLTLWQLPTMRVSRRRRP